MNLTELDQVVVGITLLNSGRWPFRVKALARMTSPPGYTGCGRDLDPGPHAGAGSGSTGYLDNKYNQGKVVRFSYSYAIFD